LSELQAFLVPKLCKKKTQKQEGLPTGSWGISRINFRTFGHNSGTRNPRKFIKGSKDSYYSLESKKNLSHKIGSFGLLPGDDDVIRM